MQPETLARPDPTSQPSAPRMHGGVWPSSRCSVAKRPHRVGLEPRGARGTQLRGVFRLRHAACSGRHHGSMLRCGRLPLTCTEGITLQIRGAWHGPVCSRKRLYGSVSAVSRSLRFASSADGCHGPATLHIPPQPLL